MKKKEELRTKILNTKVSDRAYEAFKVMAKDLKLSTSQLLREGIKEVYIKYKNKIETDEKKEN